MEENTLTEEEFPYRPKEVRQKSGTPRKKVNVQRPRNVLPQQDEWLMLVFVDEEDRERFKTWFEEEGEYAFDLWKVNDDETT